MVASVIDIRKKKSSGSGSYCEYYAMGKGIGIKVLESRYHIDYIKKFYKKAIDLLAIGTDDWEDAEMVDAAKELAIMKMLAKTNCIPKVYGLCWVKEYGKLYRIGIIMEHIEGEVLMKYYCDDNLSAEKKIEYRNAYHSLKDHAYSSWRKKYGVQVTDWHDENVMVDVNEKMYRIDFTPSWVEVNKPKTYKRLTKEALIELYNNAPQSTKKKKKLD